MKLFKLFALLLVALPSVVLGMGQDTVICENKQFDLSEITFEEHRESVKNMLQRVSLKSGTLSISLLLSASKNLLGLVVKSLQTIGRAFMQPLLSMIRLG